MVSAMRLRKIKLAGFKSFVDPTTLIVPDRPVAVVGPNGCGKSNIIDAVTWVMGESSAKHLRGDALTDVIFNGSSARQPTGQAAVELIFDNADGKLGGQYAKYNEIAIKRQINREGASAYFLNGARCRRKDIQGIFLGTGLGHRSYAIIEQGMISRLIEARPEELRTFIEEAAGISKFRERRRETENRMSHTRENIARLHDIREELEKQLNHLRRQARAAERYQALKAEERQLKAELLALDWQALSAQAKAKSKQVMQYENSVQQGLAALRRIEGDIEQQRQSYAAANEGFNQRQSTLYQQGADIAHLEQRIEHIREKLNTLGADLAEARRSEQELNQHRQQDAQQLESVRCKQQQLQPQLQGSRSRSDAAYTSLTDAEGAMQAWQSEWDKINATLAEYEREAEVGQTRLEYLQADMDEAQRRRAGLDAEFEEHDAEESAERLAQLAAERSALEEAIHQQRQQQTQAQHALKQQRARLARFNTQLAEAGAAQQANEAEIAALAARQLGDVHDHKAEIDRWLGDNNLSAAARLLDVVSVDADWSVAFETVAGHLLQDIIVDDLAAVDAGRLAAGHIGLLASGSVADHGASAYDGHDRPRLLDKVSMEAEVGALARLLARVYIADNAEQARQILPQLGDDESVITRQGLWLGHYRTHINRPAADAPGILSREQQLTARRRQQQKLGQDIEQLQAEADDAGREIERQEQRIIALQQRQAGQQDEAAATRARHAEFRARREQIQGRLAHIEDELAELDIQTEKDNDEITALQTRLGQLEEERTAMLAQRQTLEAARTAHQGALGQAREQWQLTHQHSHKIALQLQACSSQQASIEQAMQRSDIQLAGMRQRIAELEGAMDAEQQPLQTLRTTLAARIADKSTAETALVAAREQVQAEEAALRRQEQQRGEAEQTVAERRSALEQCRLEHQEVKVRLQGLSEQLQAMQREPAAVIGQLEEGASEPAWRERLASTERKIQRLGAINLAAIDEYEQLAERKGYLDSQSDDLNQALETLAAAIRKIDKETRTRFRETFDQLNANIKALFPALFGGGHAYLQLTTQDLLETGVTIIARPPGKKNSTIHLLSGGEKALTAVALVFSIFQLNPAPFCILDEVDAPLDDTNVARFSELVGQMSSEVQFIIITHNKITMEMAQQLLGVTMQEPGVSRLVSVDMEEAVRMAATA